MGDDGRDPFEGLRLDEDFVRAATVMEPSARARARAATRRSPAGDRPALPPPPPPGRGRRLLRVLAFPLSPLFLLRRRLRARGVRRAAVLRTAAVVALVGSVAALGVAAFGRGGDRGSRTAAATPLPGPSASPRVRSSEPGVLPTVTGGAGAGASVVATIPASGSLFEVGPGWDARLAAGHCLQWTPAPGHPARVEVVECSAPHRAEVTAVVGLSPRFRDWPGSASLDQVASDECRPALLAYLGGGRPGAAHAGWVWPQETAWRAGQHSLACTAVGSGDVTTGSLRTGGTPA